MCRPGILSSTICSPLDDPPTDPSQCRKSFFPCYDCIRVEAARDKQTEAEQRIAKLKERDEEAKRVWERELQVRKERVRREAVEKAEREKREEDVFQQARRVEAEKVRREGGLWIDAGSTRRKGRKGVACGGGGGAGGGGGPVHDTPRSAPAVAEGGSMGRRMGEFAKDVEPPKTATGVGGGGRAGTWGRSAGNAPRKNGSGERGGWKK
jgi:hypothetical protein